MAKFRSPILGYNHNIRHNGWLFHVQTEDSGIQSPHIFTHLFHEGVIIASKKLEYDATAGADVVKGLMQAQHKSVMKELKHGAFDAKIRAYLGEAPAAAGAEQSGSPAAGEPPPELEAIPLDVALDEAAATLPTLAPEVADDASAGASSPYVQMMVSDEAELATVSGTLHVSAEPAAARRTPEPEPESDDDDINRLLMRLRAETPPPELLDESPTEEMQAANASGESPGAWVVARPGQKERPFERSNPIEVAEPEESVRRVLTPPSIEVPQALQDGSSYAQHRKAAGTSTPGAGTRLEGTGTGPRRPVAPPPPRGLPQRPPPIPQQAQPKAPAPPTRPYSPVRTTAPQRIPAPPVLPRGASTPAASGPRSGSSAAQTPVLPRSPPAGGRAPAPTPVLPRGQAASGPRAPTPAPAITSPMRTPPLTVTPRRGISGEGVVVARPAVVIGAPATPAHGPAAPGDAGGRRAHGRESAPPVAAHDGLFGHEMISEKSLDEVIMAYLSEDANDE